MAQDTRLTRRLVLVTLEISTTSAPMLLNAVPMAMPRAVPAGGVVFQLPSAAAASSTANQRRLDISRLRRNWYGFWPAASASSSIMLSTAKVLIDAPTERQNPTGIGEGWLTHSVTFVPKAYG